MHPSPASQFGAVPGRGTDFAHHIVDTVWNMAALMGMSVALLFLDLQKAFDKACREAVMGFPASVLPDDASREQHLRNIGFPEHVVREIVSMARGRQPILQEWGVTPKAVRLISALHSGSWFQYGQCEQIAETRQGGRQGCKLGGTVFNALYAEAVVRLVRKLREAGLIAKIVVRGSPFEPPCERGVATTNVELVDVVFVDDLVIMLLAKIACCPSGKHRCAHRGTYRGVHPFGLGHQLVEGQDRDAAQVPRTGGHPGVQ